ncbi:MAG: ATP-dependent RNA helicase DbpA [Gammaproteobacteria bacterium]|nr:ATP-dependent RNA helicase DbpA [Gammaproteobacteria bacterium]
MSQTDFASLNLHSVLIENLVSLGYQTMTPIQAKSLPHILAGKDVIGQGKTGSGKTAAFGLGLLQKLDTKNFNAQSLVLCPTRELADQVANELRKLARTTPNVKVLTLCGGVAFGPQVGSLEHGAHIIVGTPGRVEEHLRKNTLKLSGLTTLVLDEADRMLDMGFEESLDAIIERIPSQRQTLLFSATYPDQIRAIANRIMNKPAMAQVDSSHTSESIQQVFYKFSSNGNGKRLTALRLVLMHYCPESAVVFCNTKVETQEVADELCHYGFSAIVLNGDMEQRDRDQAMVRFANKSASILVATDVAARGLDIEALDLVVNYHVPRDNEVHTHRIGRTGRAGSKGMACTLYSDKESHKIERLEAYMGQTCETEPLPPIELLEQPAYQSRMATLQIDGGKKQKIRPGDILGALTGSAGIEGEQVGKIQISESWAYVAVKREVAQVALAKLQSGKVKGRTFRVRQI